jgi:hypothetical protein
LIICNKQWVKQQCHNESSKGSHRD